MGITNEIQTPSGIICGGSKDKLCTRGAGLDDGQKRWSQLKLSSEQLRGVRDKLLELLNQSLKQKEQGKAGISALPTFVTTLPDGTEKGTFLALDLGGSNFRIVKVELPGTGDRKVEISNQVYKLPESIISSTAEEFFDHIAKCLSDFICHHELGDRRLPLGFTFAFPCCHKGLNQSVLLRWTKDFRVSGVVGKDIVKLLEDAIERQVENGVKCLVDIIVVINDTVGTLMSCAHQDRNCKIGMIVGNGTNACYMESVENIASLSGAENLERKNQMCINTEWGKFGEDGSLDDIRTSYDHTADSLSSNPGFMIFEKMISCLYLGDVVQEILKQLVQERTLFDGVLSEEMKTPHSFESSFLTQIEREAGTIFPLCGQILSNLGYPSSTTSERHTVRNVCKLVSDRAAQLCAAGLSALIERTRISQRIEKNETLQLTVAVDGTLYKKHPTFKHIVSSTLQDLSPLCNVTFSISYDGGGKGAALCAAAACRVLTDDKQHDCRPKT